jgi:uncharacterized protein HemX
MFKYLPLMGVLAIALSPVAMAQSSHQRGQAHQSPAMQQKSDAAQFEQDKAASGSRLDAMKAESDARFEQQTQQHEADAKKLEEHKAAMDARSFAGSRRAGIEGPGRRCLHLDPHA